MRQLNRGHVPRFHVNPEELDSVENGSDKVAYGGLVVGCGILTHTVGDNGADSHGLVAHQSAEPLEWCAFHLVVGHPAPFAAPELFDTTVEVGIREGEAEFPSLRSVKSYS